MNTLKFIFLNAISKDTPLTFEDILRNERLGNRLWIELILNPEVVEVCKLHIDNPTVKDALTKALSWYLGFKWLFSDNRSIEELYKKEIIKPYQIKGYVYRKDRRTFLKGILHARLC